MIIRSLYMEDFRKYRGAHTINLSVDWGSGKNIVLIGGLNGNGKTSLMIALRMALFGKLNDDLWRRSSYKSFVRNCLNRSSAASGKREFGLAVELETGNVSGIAVLRIERRWRLTDSDSIQETIRLFSNGRERTDLGPEEAELFILERIPYGMSKFIFFDGDRLQDLMHQETFGSQIRDALQSIFGLRLYQDLLKDLSTHERSLVRSHSNDQELQALMQAVDRAYQALDDVRIRKERLTRELSGLEQRLANLQSERVRLGVSYQLDRNEMGQHLIQLRKEREDLQQELAALLSLDLPMLVLRPHLRVLQRTIEEEAVVEQETLVQRLLQRKKEDFLTSLSAIGAAEKAAVVSQAWDAVFSPQLQLTEQKFRHLSLDQKYSLISQIESLESTASRDVRSLIRKLEDVEHRIRKVQNDLRSLPSDPHSLKLEEEERRLIVAIKDLSQEIGSLAVDERLKQHELTTAKRSEESARLKQRLETAIQQRVDVERAVFGCVQDFVNRLCALKIGELETYMARMFHRLTREDQVVRSFLIDRTTFEVHMADDNGTRYDLDMLSEGEKEIFVLSFLWAVNMAAVEELPMVVDTPLGRLDSLHRNHIAEHFFPAANRQMIILSTDTEVDPALMFRLEPYIARTYRLESSSETQGTTIVPGYFEESAYFVH